MEFTEKEYNLLCNLDNYLIQRAELRSELTEVQNKIESITHCLKGSGCIISVETPDRLYVEKIERVKRTVGVL